MHKPFISPVLSIFLLSAFLCSVAYAQQSGNQSMDKPNFVPMSEFTSQKAMNMENYEPMPGDLYTLTLSLGGEKEPPEYAIILQHDLTLELPYIGTFNAKGMTFSQMQSGIIKKIRAAIPLQFISFMLESPAQFDVFVYGHLKSVGFMTVNSLTRLSDALTNAGGFQPTASARSVEIVRGETRKPYDLKVFETEGKVSENPFLKPGDKIYVPQKKQSVTIVGAVPYPGEYEFLPEETLSKILMHAGGLSRTAAPGGISVLRLDEKRNYNVVIGQIDPERFILKPEDRINVKSALENIDIVTIEGAVFGSPVSENGQTIPAQSVRFRIPFHAGLSLLEALQKAGGPTPFADDGKAYLIRKSAGDRIPLPNLGSTWQNRDSTKDMPLEPGDYLVIPIKKLRVFISGEVNGIGTYDYIEGFRVGDYLTAAGGIKDDRGNPDGIFLIDIQGKKTKVGMESPVPPGSRIRVEKNGWIVTQDVFTTVFVVTSIVTGITTFTKAIIEFIEFISPRLQPAKSTGP